MNRIILLSLILLLSLVPFSAFAEDAARPLEQGAVVSGGAEREGIATKHKDAQAEVFVFGTSELGREMTCTRIGSDEARERMLIIFAVHGFEDAKDHDGQYLVDIAQNLIAHYKAHPDALGDYALYIVPCMNPDGLAEGKSEQGFGRCNAKGIDINRDFPEAWKRQTTARYRTGDEPFAAAEARALRILVEAIKPTAAVDVHGWINRVYGTQALSQVFMDAFGFEHYSYRSGGMASRWLQTLCAEAVLVELPARPAREGYVTDMTEKMIEALNKWFE